MRIFVAGATGTIGRRLVERLSGQGHEVVGMTRSPDKVDALRGLGAAAVVADGLDAAAVMRAVTDARPEVVVHEMTALSDLSDLRRFEQELQLTNRLRSEGTDHLLAAALAAGARRFVAQSFIGWAYGAPGGPAQIEEDPFATDLPAPMRPALAAIQHLESATTGAEGIEGVVLRYANFYGPDTGFAPGGGIHDAVAARRLPVLGGGGGIWSFLHIDDAVEATLLATRAGEPGVYNLADDEPSAVRDWLPAFAASIGAAPPRRVPAWLGRLIAGSVAVHLMTRVRGASNEKAKRELGWSPRFPSWRQGFQEREQGGADASG